MNINLNSHIGIYCRKTRGEDEDIAQSLENQKRLGIEYAQRQQRPCKVYCESEAIGGDVWDRPKLQEMISDIVQNELKTVFVRQQDRLYRSQEIFLRLKKIIIKHNVRVITMDGTLDLRSASGIFAVTVQAAAAEYEKSMTGERIRAMKRNKVHNGLCAGGPPVFGYTSNARLKHELMMSGKTLMDAEKQANEVFPQSKSWFVD